ncbi:hypothetical protein [Gottfriedia luciferensis]|uniref:hypothetical protein n=1 Tax=Gottfriedia luciferensis TaxID=178774 RepID=UPI000B43ACBB|nr:hypothetical protein [Gottfriedia luciferensis]
MKNKLLKKSLPIFISAIMVGTIIPTLAQAETVMNPEKQSIKNIAYDLSVETVNLHLHFLP